MSGLLDADPAAAKSLVEELSANVRQALQDAAELARTICPPLLEARGLASALRSAADSAGVTLIVDIPPGAHYPPEITATVYWTYVNAVSSAAVASETTVTVLDDSNGLTFEITVAGQVPEDRLDRLRDRIEALDGRVSVERPNGRRYRAFTAGCPRRDRPVALGQVEDDRLDALVDRRLPGQSRAS